MKTTSSALTAMAFVCLAQGAQANVIDTTALKLVGIVQTQGEYDNAGLGTWNGAPLSPENQPTPEQDQLSATLSFYVDRAHKNDLYVVVSNVFDTDFGFITGTPFEYVALTGITFSLPIRGASPTRNVEFSNGIAVEGETLLGPNSGQSSPLTTTPNWALQGVSGPRNDPSFSISTPDVSDALTHFPSVYGTTRIGGGAAFEFSFNPNVNLLRRANFLGLDAETFFGFDMYESEGTLLYAYTRPSIGPAVPEPTTWSLMVAGFAAMAFLARQRDRQRSSPMRPTPGSGCLHTTLEGSRPDEGRDFDTADPAPIWLKRQRCTLRIQKLTLASERRLRKLSHGSPP